MAESKHSIKSLKVEEILSPENADFYHIQHPHDALYDSKLNPNAHQENLLLSRGIYIMEEWWDKQNVSVNYPITKNASYCLYRIPEIEEYVREFHREVCPKQDIAKKFLVFGLGATQVLHAAMYAISIKHSQKKLHKRLITPLYFTSQKPSYLDSRLLIDSFSEFNLRWIEFEDAHRIEDENLVEMITSPNNPNGQLLKKATTAHYNIHDRVNLWPFLLGTADCDETLEKDEISVFSLAKIFSFSGSRVGYAFVNDEEIANYMSYFIIRETHGVCADGQMRCLTALKYLIDNDKTKLYIKWVNKEFKQRWELISKAFAKTKMTLLNSNGPNLWIKTPGNAERYLKENYHIEGTYGSEYGASDEYARLNMQCSRKEFSELIWRLQNIKRTI